MTTKGKGILSDGTEARYFNLLCISCAFFITLYIFCAHFAYPFSSTIFLYAGFFVGLIALVSTLKLKLSSSIALYILILTITGAGCLFSENSSRAERQLVFFLIYGVIYWLSQQSEYFTKYAQKIIYWMAFIGMSSVFVQFMFPIPFNLFVSKAFRSDVYENIMWSYNVDGSFTGLTPSVSMASFSMAIVFFVNFRNLTDYIFKNNLSKKRSSRRKLSCKIYYTVMAVIALIGILLTNKRGIFIAVIISFVFSIVLDKDISIKKLNSKEFILLLIALACMVGFGYYYLTHNEQAVHFFGRFESGNMLTGRDVFYKKAIAEISQDNTGMIIWGGGTASAYSVNDTGLHNVYLQILYDHGIIGLVVYLCFFICNLKKAVKKRYLCSMSLQIVFLAYCMSGNPLYDYYFFIPYLLFTNYKA